MMTSGFKDDGNPMSDAELLAEIASYRKAIKDASQNNVGVVRGEGRYLEFTTSNVALARDELRNLLYVARQRGLEIGGTGGAIGVEF